LARLLELDVSTLYRHERANHVPVLLDYALRGIEAEYCEAEKAPIRNDVDPLAPERYSRAGKRVIAYLLDRRRRKRAAKGIDPAELEQHERELDKQFRPMERMLQRTAKRDQQKNVRRRVKARAEANEFLDKVRANVKAKRQTGEDDDGDRIDST
jgi:hypothetical protein